MKDLFVRLWKWLNSDLTKQKKRYSQVEDNIIFDAKCKGFSFKEIAKLLPNRTEASIRSRWKLIVGREEA